jgi:hypothetical protein
MNVYTASSQGSFALKTILVAILVPYFPPAKDRSPANGAI